MTKSRLISKVIAIKKLSSSSKNVNLFMLFQIQKKYFVKCTNAYEFEIELYVVLEYMSIFLIQVIAILVYLKKTYVTSIVDQIEFQSISLKR